MPATISKNLRIFPLIISNWLLEMEKFIPKMKVQWEGCFSLNIARRKKKVCLMAKLHIKWNVLGSLFSICLWTRTFRIIRQLSFPPRCVGDDQSWPFTFSHIEHCAWGKLFTQSSVPVNWACLSAFWGRSTRLQMEIQVGHIYNKPS